nr:MAG TPA: hypothetical protein [Caudoviricetes sp.]
MVRTYGGGTPDFFKSRTDTAQCDWLGILLLEATLRLTLQLMHGCNQ